MYIGDTLKIINTIFAILALPPAISITAFLIHEKINADALQRNLNRTLIFLFCGVSTVSFLNAVVSITALFDAEVAHYMYPARNIILNVFLFITSWCIYFIKIEIERLEMRRKK